MLIQAAGLSRRDAAVQVKTAQRLQALPDVQRAVEGGQVSFANAKTLADASDKTSPEAVTEDSELLAKAASLPPDRFAREAGRWASQRQDDGGEAAWKRLRRRRRLSIWDGDDGIVHLRGEFDPVAGAKLRKRLHEQAESLRRNDLKLPEDERRTRHQRMADALEELTAGRSVSGAGRCSGRRADIAIVQHLSADGTRDVAEIAGGETIPQSVLDEHMCNSRITGIVFSDKGVPLWHGHTKTIATEAQFRALIAKYGGCAGCDAQPLLCQAHHIRPVSQGGVTDITNMIPLCWHCHQKVHHYGWKVVPDGRGLRTIEPPDRISYGPARASDLSPVDDRPVRSSRSRHTAALPQAGSPPQPSPVPGLPETPVPQHLGCRRPAVEDLRGHRSHSPNPKQSRQRNFSLWAPIRNTPTLDGANREGGDLVEVRGRDLGAGVRRCRRR